MLHSDPSVPLVSLLEISVGGNRLCHCLDTHTHTYTHTHTHTQTYPPLDTHTHTHTPGELKQHESREVCVCGGKLLDYGKHWETLDGRREGGRERGKERGRERRKRRTTECS